MVGKISNHLHHFTTHTHPDSHSTPFALNSALWPFILFQHPTLTAQKLTKSHTCFQTILISTQWFRL